MLSLAFNLILMLLEKIAPDDVIFMKVYSSDFSHESFAFLSWFCMLSAKIAPDYLIFLNVYKPDVSHAVLGF